MVRRMLTLIVLGAIIGFAVGSAFILAVFTFNLNYIYAGRPLDVGGGIYVWGGIAGLFGALIGMAGAVAFSPDPDASLVGGTSGH